MSLALGGILTGALKAAATTGLTSLVGNAISSGISRLFGSSSQSSATSSNSSYSGQSSSSTTGTSSTRSTSTGNTSALGNLWNSFINGVTGNNSLATGLYNLGSSALANYQEEKNALTQFKQSKELMAYQAQLNQQAADKANAYTTQLQQNAMDFNSSESQKERDWQEQMSNTSYQRGVADLKAAGLNPILAAYTGYGASSGSGAEASIGTGSASSAGGVGLGSTSKASTHAAALSAMYEYSNMTMDTLQKALDYMNSAKQTNDATTKSTAETITHELSTQSAKTISELSEIVQQSSNYQNVDKSQTQTSEKKESSEKSGSASLEGSWGSEKASEKLKHKWSEKGHTYYDYGS